VRVDHYLCDDCWDALHPDRPSPRFTLGVERPCCRCGRTTRSGIWFRGGPFSFPCGNEGPAHAEEEESDAGNAHLRGLRRQLPNEA
jgi:hypothetical protein